MCRTLWWKFYEGGRSCNEILSARRAKGESLFASMGAGVLDIVRTEPG